MIPATALATTPTPDEYYTVAWVEPYPQTLHAWTSTGTAPNLDALDDQLTGCADYQVDVYRINGDRDRTKLEGLITSGVLNKGDDYSIYYSSKHVEVTDCETTTTTTIGTTTTTTTAPTTTSTVIESTTTTQEPSTTTSVPASTTTDTQPPVLPNTGSNPLIAVAGLSLLLLGLMMVQLVRNE